MNLAILLMKLGTRSMAEKHNLELEEFLRKEGCSAELHELSGTTRTVDEAVKELGVDRHEILKTMVMICDEDQPVLAYVLGDRRICHGKLKQALAAKSVRFASAEEVLETTGYEVGAVPPVGHRKVLRAVMDREVLNLERVVGGGGKANCLMSINPKDIVRLVRPQIVDISE